MGLKNALGPLVALAIGATLAAACSGGDDSSSSGPECTQGAVECSDDVLSLRECVDGKWQATECMQEQGKLCQAGQCVDPWRWGDPSFDQCAADPHATSESLHAKAEYFEDVSRRLHVHPQLGWMMGVRLPCNGSDCSAPLVSETTATYDDVESWGTGENDGLWSALYMGAEAYRWAVTQDPLALDMLKLLLDTEKKRMEITGVPGLFTRQLIPPNVKGIACPTDPKAYVPDDNKDENRWVRVADDGCLETTDPTTLAWTKSKVCGLGKFAGWCFLDNVSEDEYSGHMFALGAVAKLVTDPDVQTTVKGLLAQVGDHLIANELTFVDWDGRVTEHGRIWAAPLLGGYNAAMSLSFLKTIALATGIQKYESFYEDCLLQRSGENVCLHHGGGAPKPYDDILFPTSLNLGCKSNWNNYSMLMLSLHGLLWGEHDPVVRAKAQKVLDEEMWSPPDYDRPMSEQNNAFFDFIYASGKAMGPGDGPAVQAVENGICMLRQFPAHKVPVDLSCPASSCVEVCKDRFDNPMSDYPRPITERCLGGFVWWGSPYSVTACTADPRWVDSPADYLLAYWMGRYYGFIEPQS
jgi:hypothetical protein